MEPSLSIPVIDFSHVKGDSRAVIAHQIGEACEEWGFFQLINHGLNPELMKRMKEVSREVFMLQEEEKMKIKVTPEEFQGWYHSKLREIVGDNKLVKEGTVEHIFLIQYPEFMRRDSLYPVNPSTYRSTVLEYSKRTEALHLEIMALLLEHLGLPSQMVVQVMPEYSISTRTNFYFLQEGQESPGVCHAHSDPGCLTLLLADEVAGLEIEKDGKWVSVDPIPGAFIVNVGDVVEILSNGKYKSVEHRGKLNTEGERLTLANFYGPAWTVEIGPMKELLDQHNHARYRTCTFGEYIRDFVSRGLDGKNGVRDHSLKSESK